MKIGLNKFVALCATGLLVSAVQSFADSAATASAVAYPQSLETLIQTRELTLIKQFDTEAPTLKGYVLKDKSGKYGIAYTVQDLLVLGKVLDADGASLTDKYTAEQVPKPDFVQAVKILEKDKTLVSEGKKNAPIIYVFADPNCIFCHEFYDQTRNLVEQGKVQVKWVMVGFLKQSSPGRAAAILAAKDRVQANAQDHEKFDAKSEEGSIAELQPIPATIQTTLDSHNALMNELQFQGTPGLIFKGKDGQWQSSAGMPPLEQLAERMGIAL